MRKTMVMISISITAMLLNFAISYISALLKLPIFMDTIFTVSVTLMYGPLWGAVTGALTNLTGHTLKFWGWEGYIFALCNIATALITYFFMRLFPRDLDPRYDHAALPQSRRYASLLERIVVLMLLSFALCVGMSILGGLIASIIRSINITYTGEPGLSPNANFRMFPQSFPVIFEEILVRIPMNIIDRLIAAFCGYGIARILCKSFFKNKTTE